MAFPSWSGIYQQAINRLDDPLGQVFTPSVFQPGLNEAYDVLYAEFLKAQAPRIEIIIYVTVPQGTTQMTPAQMGISDFGDFIFLSERILGSQDRYRDLDPVDRLSQRPQNTLLGQFNYRDNCFFFIGATNAIDLQVKYDTSGVAPVSDGTSPTKDALITVDSSQNFLSNYAVSVIGQRKGYDEIAQDCRALAVGRKFNDGVPGGQLYSLLSPLVRSRQNVQIAPKPFTAQRRMWSGWAAPFIAAQQGTTGGGVQAVPIQFSTFTGTIVPAPDGTTTIFVLTSGVLAFAVISLNGVTRTLGSDYTIISNQITFINGVVPQIGDTVTAEAFIAIQM